MNSTYPEKISTVDTPNGLQGLANTINTAALGGNELAKFLMLQGGAEANFLEDTLSKATATWKNARFSVTKQSLAGNSFIVKVLLGAQEKAALEKTMVRWKMELYNGWTLNGKLSDGELEAARLP